MDTQEQLATTFDKLPNFPFKSLETFWRDHQAGKIQVTLDRGIARQWAMKSQKSPGWLRSLTITLTWFPYLILLAYIVAVILFQEWVYLLGSPLVYKASDILNPGSSIRFPVVRPILILTSIISFAVSLIFVIQGLLILSIAILVLWADCNLVYSIPARFLWRSGLNDEYVVCMLWQGNALSIVYPNGDRYTHRFKVVNGEDTWYS
jgi:hypothetical protein